MWPVPCFAPIPPFKTSFTDLLSTLYQAIPIPAFGGWVEDINTSFFDRCYSELLLYHVASDVLFESYLLWNLQSLSRGFFP